MLKGVTLVPLHGRETHIAMAAYNISFECLVIAVAAYRKHALILAIEALEHMP
jgi:hypothetical protein